MAATNTKSTAVSRDICAAAVAAGTATPQQLLSVQFASGTRQRNVFTTKEEAATAVKVNRFKYERATEDRTLAFNEKHLTGCAEKDCVFAAGKKVKCDCGVGPSHTRRLPNETAMPNGARVPYCWLQCDHVDPATKMNDVGSDEFWPKVHQADKVREYKKCQVLCLYHHYLKTKEEQQWAEDPTDLRSIAYKGHRAGGCKMTSHAAGPFAEMVSSGEWMFNERSMLQRGNQDTADERDSSDGARHGRRVQAVLDGLAVIHCKFCHEAYTRLENHRLFPDTRTGPAHEDQLTKVPSFFNGLHHDLHTAYDGWTAERWAAAAAWYRKQKAPK